MSIGYCIKRRTLASAVGLFTEFWPKIELYDTQEYVMSGFGYSDSYLFVGSIHC